MWTTGGGRWRCLLTLGVMVFLSASQGGALGPQRRCCMQSFGQSKIAGIRKCYEMRQSRGCVPAYFIVTDTREFCVRPTPPWLKTLINTGELVCEPSISRRFEVLEEDFDE